MSMSMDTPKAVQIVFAKLLQSRWDAAAKVSGRKNERLAHAFSPGFMSTPRSSDIEDPEDQRQIRVLGLVRGHGFGDGCFAGRRDGRVARDYAGRGRHGAGYGWWVLGIGRG